MHDVDAPPKVDEAEVGRIFREESGRSVAALIRVFGDIDVAEDAVQEAFAVAATRVGGERRLPVCRGRYEADLVEPPALRHGPEEVADRARARDTHAFWGHRHQSVLAQQGDEAVDVDRVPGRHEPL